MCFTLSASGLRPLVPPTSPIPGSFFHPSHSIPLPITSGRDDKGLLSGVPTPTELYPLLGELCLDKLWAMLTVVLGHKESQVLDLLSLSSSRKVRTWLGPIPRPTEDLPPMSQSLENLRQQVLRPLRPQWPRPARISSQPALRKREMMAKLWAVGGHATRNQHRKDGLDTKPKRKE